MKKDIIMAGGHDLQTVETFSWATRQWTPLPPITSIRRSSSLFVHQGQMFACGGWWGEDSIESLNLKEEGAQWKMSTAKLEHGTWAHTSVVYENNLYISGGQSGGKILNSISEVFLVSPYSSRFVCRMPEPRTFHGAQRFADKVVVVGGTKTGASSGSLYTVLLCDIANNFCQTLAPLPFAVRNMATVARKNNIILIGGRNKNNEALNTVVAYDIKNQE